MAILNSGAANDYLLYSTKFDLDHAELHTRWTIEFYQNVDAKMERLFQLISKLTGKWLQEYIATDPRQKGADGMIVS